MLQATFERLESETKEVNANYQSLKRNFLELTEFKHILLKTNKFFHEVHEVDSLNWQWLFFYIGPQLPHSYYFTTHILVLKFVNKGIFKKTNPGFAFS